MYKQLFTSNRTQLVFYYFFTLLFICGLPVFGKSQTLVPPTTVTSATVNLFQSCSYNVTYNNVKLNGGTNAIYGAKPGETVSITFNYAMNTTNSQPCNIGFTTWSIALGGEQITAFYSGSSIPTSSTFQGSFTVPSADGIYYVNQGYMPPFTNQYTGAIAVIVVGGSSEYWTQNGTSLYYTTGNVGIGTTTPASKLDVNGTISINGTAVISGTGTWLGSPTGLQGPTGATGATGANGTNGSLWYTGRGTPASTLGANTDLFLDTVTANIYQKNNNAWVLTENIKGATGTNGVNGTNGSLWYTGRGTPASTLGANTDLFLDTVTANIYQKNNNAWVLTENIKGANGATGPAGSTGPAGPTGPEGPEGPEGECSCSVAAAASAAAALVSAGEATAAAAEATASAAEATVSAGEAAASATEASTSATEASTSATEAENSATEAANSVQEAEVAKDTAVAAADRATRAANGNAGGDLSGKYPNPTVSKIQGSSVSSTAPSNKQLLQWNGLSWTPTDPTTYTAGTGLKLDGTTFSAKNDTAIWNATQLKGKAISDSVPKDNQVLQWVNNKWTPTNFTAQSNSWIVDTLAGDSIMYTLIPGNIGIGTNRPTTRFQIQNGRTNSIDSAFFVSNTGSVGIGTKSFSSDYRLFVNGGIRAKKIVVESGWADYVFAPNYSLMPLFEVEEYIRLNNHLPNIPAAQEIENNGLDLSTMQVKTMEKIEELTLYMIQLAKENKALRIRLEEVENQLKERK